MKFDLNGEIEMKSFLQGEIQVKSNLHGEIWIKIKTTYKFKFNGIFYEFCFIYFFK